MFVNKHLINKSAYISKSTRCYNAKLAAFLNEEKNTVKFSYLRQCTLPLKMKQNEVYGILLKSTIPVSQNLTYFSTTCSKVYKIQLLMNQKCSQFREGYHPPLWYSPSTETCIPHFRHSRTHTDRLIISFFQISLRKRTMKHLDLYL